MAVRAYALAAAVLVLAQVAAAQTPRRFEGRVVHAVTGAPVQGATVSVVGMVGASLTDRDGRFTWSPAPPHPFEVIVTMPGRQAARSVTIEDARATEPTTITVADTVAEAVMVLGAAPSIDWTPAAAATIVGGAQIAERHAEHLAQALATVPGVGRISEGHAAVPAVRGLARGRTLILIDGARVDAERRTGPSATFLDLSVVEQVEVARGPASVAYGSDALGGVISVRTRQAEPGAPLRGRFSGTVGAGVPDRGASAEVSKGFPGGGLLVQGHARKANDYDSPDGAVLNSGWEDHGVLAHATHAAGGGFLSVVWQSDEATDVGRPRSDSSTVRFYYPFERSHRLTSSYQAGNVAGFHRVAVTGFWGTSSQRTDQDRPATATSVRRIERADVSAHDIQARGTAERQVGRARLVAGVDVHGRTGLHAIDLRRTFDASGGVAEDRENVSVDDARRIATGGFLQLDTTLGARVRLAGGIRGDHVATRNTGGFFGDRATTHTAMSGNVALTVVPVERLTLTTQLSRGFRDPVLSDRYFRGPSGRGFITGNPELEPETSLQVDLAARYTISASLQAALFVYQYDIDDLVERYEERPDSFTFRNRDRARLRGIEAEAQASLARGWTVGLAADLARGRVRGAATFLDDVAPASVSMFGRKVFRQGHAAFARVARYARDDRPGPTEVAMPAVTLVELGATARLASKLEMRGSVRNALDARYPASPDPRWVLAPGRSFSLSMVVQF